VIAIVDYQAGNLTSVKKAFLRFTHECVVTSDPAQVRRADMLVLPGVGHFSATGVLTKNELNEAILDHLRRGAPLLGICLGLQWLFDGSEEAREFSGLGIFKGVCASFPASVKSPHVGWNRIRLLGPTRLIRGIPDNSYFYFTHSFRAPVVGATTAVCQYGDSFAAAVERDNVFGVQFHPEKSGATGLRVVENFCAL